MLTREHGQLEMREDAGKHDGVSLTGTKRRGSEDDADYLPSESRAKRGPGACTAKYDQLGKRGKCEFYADISENLCTPVSLDQCTLQVARCGVPLSEDHWITGSLDHWIPGYLDTWIPGYLDTWIPVLI